MAAKNTKEEKFTLPDGSVVRIYNSDGKTSLDIDDVMKALSNPQNKESLQNLVAEYAQSTYEPPKEKPKEPKKKLSDFNKKLEKGLNWNPKENM